MCRSSFLVFITVMFSEFMDFMALSLLGVFPVTNIVALGKIVVAVSAINAALGPSPKIVITSGTFSSRPRAS